MAIIYYSKRIESKTSQGERCKVWRKPGRIFQEASHGTHLPQLWAVTAWVRCCQPGKLVRSSVPRAIIGSLYVSLEPTQIPASPKGKQRLIISHIVQAEKAYQTISIGSQNGRPSKNPSSHMSAKGCSLFNSVSQATFHGTSGCHI